MTFRFCHLVRPDVSTRGVDPHAHDRHELVFVETGGYEGVQSRRSWTCTAGQGLCYRAGVPHLGRPDIDGGTRLFIVQWSGDFVATNEDVVVVEDPGGQLRFNLWWLHDIGVDPVERQEQCESLWASLLAQIAWQRDHPHPDDVIANLHRFLRLTCYIHIDRQELVRRSGMGLSTLTRRFRERYGLPPMQYLQRVRAERAAALIATTSDDLATIAPQVGLESGSHLSRLLKKHLGATARELRRR